MPTFFQPYLSYRLSERGGGVRWSGYLSTGGLLTQFRSILFFVHGYNNDQLDASAAYERFAPLLPGGPHRVLGVYWPGDNWSSGAYYMQAIGKAKDVAKSFARDIHFAAIGAGRLDLLFVSHSLGGRMVLETLRELRELLRTQPAAGLRIRGIVFMAGAVPTKSLQEQKPMNLTVRDLAFRSHSVYSEADRVLHYGFALGETLGGDAFFPVALGRTQWRGASSVSPAMTQAENPGADHSDYWGGSSQKAASVRTAAAEVEGFMQALQGGGARAVPTRRTTSARSLGSARLTSARRV